MSSRRPSRAKPVSDAAVAHLSQLSGADLRERIARLRRVDPAAYVKAIAALIVEED